MTTVAMPVFSTKNETVSAHTDTLVVPWTTLLFDEKHPEGIRFPNNDSFPSN